ncbi:6265_t:CDS:2, partial [Gigaspora margarita]
MKSINLLLSITLSLLLHSKLPFGLEKFPTPEEKNFFGIRILKWEKVKVEKGALH